ncbi:MAG: MFS transporter [Massilia sp.]|jgi:D-galactonate transporter|uniref:Putative tartrate transporter n=1 Tax=Massilia aurea TaxID=373040 RepID=A0A7W9WZI7_9BURK|nr:MFS transporter [Massilia aurea]MBB6133710.1 D-galactonate transporter [Massilia aurea]MBD8542110.1 MFS transporter [Oxalobacteraceae sp. CFBP 8761]MBD8631218.1 MFS transporter [Oxalobacteraceae sp. CFBP 8755]MBD8723376.1 MFS transporter [Oxalobacteraceae sp. CFBP 13708]
MSTIASTPGASLLEGAYRKATWRLIPFIFVCYFFNYLDRVNVGFAKLEMLDALQLSETVYGLGAGIFFIGYVTFGVPSNLILHKLGARRWIAVMMMTWGALSACMLFVSTPVEFYVLRFFTGVAEAGFFPGMVLYFTKWFPAHKRGQVMALFMSAIPVSGLIGGPLSGWMLSHFSAGQGGMDGWQWLFLLQGIPTVLLGVAVLFYLNDSLAQAPWLTAEEKTAMQTALDEDEAQRSSGTHAVHSFGAVLRDWHVWMLGFIYFSIQMGVYAINFWLPSIIKSLGFESATTVGWLSAIPYLFAGVFMVLVGRSADRRRERRWHLSAPLLMALAGLLLAANFSDNVVLVMIGLSLATMGALTGLPMFWPLPAAFLGSAAAAAGLALINSMGQIAGFLSPFLVGWIKDATGSTDMALYILSTVLFIGAMLVLVVPARLVNR